MLLDDLLQEEDAEYEDERIISSLYMISLSTSLRKLESMKPSESMPETVNIRASGEKQGDVNTEKADKSPEAIQLPEPSKTAEFTQKAGSAKRRAEEYQKAVEENEWLLDVCQNAVFIPVISLDRLQSKVDNEKKSCDGLFYYAKADEEKLSLLMELKNTGRKQLLEFIGDNGSDGMAGKVRDSLELLRNHIEFQGGYSGDDLIRHTHLVFVYGGKADTISNSTLGYGEKSRVERDHRGRQSRAATVKRISVKQEEQVLKQFGEYVEKSGLASCPYRYFGFPSRDPEEDKTPQGKKRKFTIFSKEDLNRVIEECSFFEDWEWGNYGEASRKDCQSEEQG